MSKRTCLFISILLAVSCGDVNFSPTSPTTETGENNLSLVGCLKDPDPLAIDGTIFVDPNIVKSSDPTTFKTISYLGIANRIMFDRRLDAFVDYQAFLFEASFTDGLRAEIQVNPEFQTPEAAGEKALKYSRLIGQLPNILRSDLRAVWIHRGEQPLGGSLRLSSDVNAFMYAQQESLMGSNSLLIHTDQADIYESMGVLEEVFIHETTHTSIDPHHAQLSYWVQTQQIDMDFISTYARIFPEREDLAESFLPWMALRYRRDRISSKLANTIPTRMCLRLTYFDNQRFNMFPVR